MCVFFFYDAPDSVKRTFVLWVDPDQDQSVQDHPDHGASKETRNPFWERTPRFL